MFYIEINNRNTAARVTLLLLKFRPAGTKIFRTTRLKIGCRFMETAFRSNCFYNGCGHQGKSNQKGVMTVGNIFRSNSIKIWNLGYWT